MMQKTPMILAAVFLLQLAGPVTAASNIDRGGDLSFDCKACHGMKGEGNFETPAIAGLDEVYILNRLENFQCGQRKSTDGMMQIYTQERSEQDLKDLAAYWASLKKPQ